MKVSPSMKALTTRDFWDERHKKFHHKKYYPSPRRDYLDFALTGLFPPLLLGRKGEEILEIGCGGSVWLPYFHKEYGLVITGIDYSEPGIALSRQILNKNGAEGRLIQENVFDREASLAGSFDIVFSLGFIEHFREPQKALEVSGNLLRPGGLLLTWIPNTAGWILKAGQILDKTKKGFYSPLDLEQLVDLHRALHMNILMSQYTQFLDLSYLGLSFLPPLARRFFSYIIQGTSLILITCQRAVSFQLRSRFLCSGIFVAARKGESL